MKHRVLPNPEDRLKVLEMHRSGMDQRQIARIYRVSQTTISTILREQGVTRKRNRPEPEIRDTGKAPPPPPQNADVKDRVTATKWVYNKQKRRRELIRESDGQVLDYQFI